MTLDSGLAGSATVPPDRVPGQPAPGNYWLDVLAESGQRTALRLWLLDSGSRGCVGKAGWYAQANLGISWFGMCTH